MAQVINQARHDVERGSEAARAWLDETLGQLERPSWVRLISGPTATNRLTVGRRSPRKKAIGD